MKLPKSTAFPFARFDPVLRRDLSTVLDSVRRDVEFNEMLGRSNCDRAALKDEVISILAAAAQQGERCPLKLYEIARRVVESSRAGIV